MPHPASPSTPTSLIPYLTGPSLQGVVNRDIKLEVRAVGKGVGTGVEVRAVGTDVEDGRRLAHCPHPRPKPCLPWRQTVPSPPVLSTMISLPLPTPLHPQNTLLSPPLPSPLPSLLHPQNTLLDTSPHTVVPDSLSSPLYPQNTLLNTSPHTVVPDSLSPLLCTRRTRCWTRARDHLSSCATLATQRCGTGRGSYSKAVAAGVRGEDRGRSYLTWRTRG